MEKWYVVMARSRQEKSAATILEQAGIPTYYPELKERIYIRGIQQARLAALFPGYFFAKFDFESQMRMVSYCRGVRKIVVFGHTPAEVDPKFLDEIRSRLEQQHMNHVHNFKRGELVHICRGPLTGINAVFDFSLPSKERGVVLLRALYYQSRAVVQLSDIERYQEAV